jgi:hypothetical protein
MKTTDKKVPKKEKVNAKSKTEKGLDVDSTAETKVKDTDKYGNPLRITDSIFKKYKEQNQAIFPAPYIVRIDNRSKECLYNVEILNPDFEKQDKIEYSMLDKSITYLELICQLEVFPQDIKRMKYVVLHDNAYITAKQLHNTITLSYYEKDNGGGYGMPLQLYPDSNKPNSYTVDAPYKFLIDNANCITKLTLGFLLPNAEILFYFFPEPKTPIR